MNRENSGLLVALVLAIALPLVALAGLRAVEKHEGHQLLVGATVNNYATHEACVAAAIAAGVGTFKCKDVTSVTVEFTCEGEPPPPKPPQTDAWAVQVSENEWRTDVPGWVEAPAPACWVRGRVPLKEDSDGGEQELEQEPGPWVYGIDYAVGTACPVASPPGCYIPPHPDVPAPSSP